MGEKIGVRTGGGGGGEAWWCGASKSEKGKQEIDMDENESFC